jgi:hypothetical protein
VKLGYCSITLSVFLLLAGCTAKKKPRAQYVIPKECAKVELLEDLPIDKSGNAIGKAKFRVTSSCTKVKP